MKVGAEGGLGREAPQAPTSTRPYLNDLMYDLCQKEKPTFPKSAVRTVTLMPSRTSHFLSPLPISFFHITGYLFIDN